MKIGDILYCYKDFQCKSNTSFYCEKGEHVMITMLNNNIFVIIKHTDNMLAGDLSTYVVYIRTEKIGKDIADAWEYFEDKTRRASRLIKEHSN